MLSYGHYFRNPCRIAPSSHSRQGRVPQRRQEVRHAHKASPYPWCHRPAARLSTLSPLALTPSQATVAQTSLPAAPRRRTPPRPSPASCSSKTWASSTPSPDFRSGAEDTVAGGRCALADDRRARQQGSGVRSQGAAAGPGSAPPLTIAVLALALCRRKPSTSSSVSPVPTHTRPSNRSIARTRTSPTSSARTPRSGAADVPALGRRLWYRDLYPGLDLEITGRGRPVVAATDP